MNGTLSLMEGSCNDLFWEAEEDSIITQAEAKKVGESIGKAVGKKFIRGKHTFYKGLENAYYYALSDIQTAEGLKVRVVFPYDRKEIFVIFDTNQMKGKEGGMLDGLLREMAKSNKNVQSVTSGTNGYTVVFPFKERVVSSYIVDTLDRFNEERKSYE